MKAPASHVLGGPLKPLSPYYSSLHDKKTEGERKKEEHDESQTIKEAENGKVPRVAGQEVRLRGSTATKSSNIEIDKSELQIGKCIGTGAFGSVHQGSWRGTEVAVKVLHSSASTATNDNQAASAKEEFLAELTMLAFLRVSAFGVPSFTFRVSTHATFAVNAPFCARFRASAPSA